ncbi:opsin 7, group member d isoform X1 [Denticeps clupeoides]|uniref:opsin 7, group member d isoform X1 n=1 Tax=Denticeps clupeoides TaxID=299321 RepID=UPI0010A55ACD|nr:opsin-5-like isoform X1 [Denticeps clupeoides]XP_028849703.1 opsin-5-like isoform X1 [Denticeps clupeoides]
MGNASETQLFVSSITAEYDVFMGIMYTIFCALSLLGNGVLLLVAYRKRSSLKPAEFFIVNLSISDLGMTITLFPLAIPSAFYHRWLFGDWTCLYYAFCGVLFGLCSLTNLTALSSVCCLKVCFPHYVCAEPARFLTKASSLVLGNKFSSSHARLLVAGVWLYALVFAVGPLAHWGRYGPEPYGTACCIDWYAPSENLLAMSYIVCLFIFCYVLPCTVIFSSYTFILLTVRGSRQAVQQHVSPQTKTTNAHTLIVKLSVAVCIGFLGAWSPYAVVAMWAAFVETSLVPPVAFALAAIFAKSSTIYNPVVYLLFKPNFRKSLCCETAQFRRKICSSSCQGTPRPGLKDPNRPTSQRGHKDVTNSTRLSNGLPESHGPCLHCAEAGPQLTTPQLTARVLTGSTHSEVTVSQLSDKMQGDFL